MIVCLGTTPALARAMEFASVSLDGVNRASRVTEYAAGKAINVARAAATLGERVAHISTAGGATGEMLRTHAPNVEASDYAPVEAPTRLCVTVIDHAAGTSTELIEESGELTPAEGERVLALLETRLTDARICVLAGSLAPGLKADFYARCIRSCRAKGVRVILDASGPALAAAIAERPEMVKINAAELATIESIGGDDEQSIAAAAGRLSHRTGGWVIVTRGHRSTLAVSTSQSLAVTVPKMKVLSAIGSGDSFAGGLAVAQVRGLPMDESLRLATACASANALTPLAAHFDLNTVETLREAIEVRRLDDQPRA